MCPVKSSTCVYEALRGEFMQLVEAHNTFLLTTFSVKSLRGTDYRCVSSLPFSQYGKLQLRINEMSSAL